MYYFKENEDKIEKYLITFDKEEVKRLRDRMVIDCGFNEHNEYTSDYRPTFDKKMIKNFSCTFVGKKEYIEETRDVYAYVYDLYKEPELVTLINKLLSGNKIVIKKILNYTVNKQESIDVKIKKANEELALIDVNDIVKKERKLSELNSLVKTKELNKNQKSIEPYYKELLGLIKCELVDSILTSELVRVEKFVEASDIQKEETNEKTPVKVLANRNWL